MGETFVQYLKARQKDYPDAKFIKAFGMCPKHGLLLSFYTGGSAEILIRQESLAYGRDILACEVSADFGYSEEDDTTTLSISTYNLAFGWLREPYKAWVEKHSITQNQAVIHRPKVGEYVELPDGDLLEITADGYEQLFKSASPVITINGNQYHK